MAENDEMNGANRGKGDRSGEKQQEDAAQGPESAGQTPSVSWGELTRNEIQALIASASTIRDKALISVLYEAHASTRELCSITWADLTFDDDTVRGTLRDLAAKRERCQVFVDSRDLLIALKNSHAPGMPRGDNFVFVEDDGRPMTGMTLRRMLESVWKKASVTMPSIAGKGHWCVRKMSRP